MSKYLSVIYDLQRKPLTKYPYFLTKYLIDRYTIKRNSILLEIGCGRCDFLNEFLNQGMNCYGVDKDDEASVFFKSKNFFNVDLEKNKLPFEDNYFDVIFTKSFVEHFYYPEKIFQEIHRVLKPGGLVITLTPDWENIYKIFYEDFTHRTPFTLNSLKDIHLMNNFNDVKVEKFKQLPILWSKNVFSNIFKIISKITEILPDKFKNYKWVRFSKEIMLLSTARK